AAGSAAGAWARASAMAGATTSAAAPAAQAVHAITIAVSGSGARRIGLLPDEGCTTVRAGVAPPQAGGASGTTAGRTVRLRAARCHGRLHVGRSSRLFEEQTGMTGMTAGG